VKIVLIGAGSRSFGPATMRDLFLSDVLNERGDVQLVLMDKLAEPLGEAATYGEFLNQKLGRRFAVHATTDLCEAVDGADFVVTAIEVRRYHYWTQDFHVPRLFGFRQVFGENGGPGSLFHALRNMGPMVQIARQMQRRCPAAWLLNFTNPEHKLCEAITRLTTTPTVGLCHGVAIGRKQLSQILGIADEHLQTEACGINHLTFFQSIRDARSGEDLYPRLRELDRQGDEISGWHRFGLGRIIFRRFGLWPSPASNHYGEYIRWAEEFVASELQFYYDPATGEPWRTGQTPRFIYELTGKEVERPWLPQPPTVRKLEDQPIRPSGELAMAIIEGIGCGQRRDLAAVNVPNRGHIPNLPEGCVVEVPGVADAAGLHPQTMQPLPEGIAAIIRTQASIHQLLVEAFAEQSRDKLLQAILLDPTVDSYRRAVAMLDRMIELQADILPPLR
jgi:alpha-galactosidase